MILTGQKIKEEYGSGRIELEPFCESRVNPNSYDLRLGRLLKTYTSDELDTRRSNPTTTLSIPEEGVILKPGRIYLAHTQERLGSDHFVPIIRAKSSIARLGLFVHVTADLIDIGFHGQCTLQLNPIQAVKVYPMMKIAQVTFWQVSGDIQLYDGKYQGAEGPMESLSFRDRVER